MGAWIETSIHNIAKMCLQVAPRMGAWIETRHGESLSSPFLRRAPHGRVD